MLARLVRPDIAEKFPLLRQPLVKRKVALVLLTANRGLCGAFNTNLIREARARISEMEQQGAQVDVHIVGKKGIAFFKYLGRAISSERIDIGDRPSATDAASIVDALTERFAKGDLDGVYITYAKYVSALSTPATTEQVVPVVPPATQGAPRYFLLSPSAEVLVEALLPAYVRNMVYRALVETVAGEQSARRTAMKNATDNASDMITLLRRTYNSARQAQITQEIAEIVGGAAALE